MDLNTRPDNRVASGDRDDKRMLATRIVSAATPGDGPDTFDTWVQHLAYLAEPSLIDEADRSRFGFSIEYIMFRDMNISTTITANPQRFVRTNETVMRTGVSNILIQVFEAGGQQGLYHRRPVVVKPGDVLMVDLAKPFDISVAASKVMCLMLPRNRLPPAMRDRDLHGALLHPGHAATNLLALHLRRFAGVAATLTVAEAVLAAEATIPLAEAAFRRAVRSAPEADAPDDRVKPDHAAALDRQALDRVLAYIEDTISDVNLTGDKIGVATALSRSTLHRLFHDRGGVAAYIRERRLRRGFEVINQDLCPEQRLGTIGLNQGFSSEAHFSRLFLKRFGLSPGAARKAARERRNDGAPMRVLQNATDMPPLSVSGKTS